MTLDAPLRTVAQSVLKQFGTTVTLRVVTGTAYNTTTRTMTPTTADFPWKVRYRNYKSRELSDTIRATDLEVTGAAADLTVTPKESDKIVIGSAEWDVLSVQSELATDQAALYILQIRR